TRQTGLAIAVERCFTIIHCPSVSATCKSTVAATCALQHARCEQPQHKCAAEEHCRLTPCHPFCVGNHVAQVGIVEIVRKLSRAIACCAHRLTDEICAAFVRTLQSICDVAERSRSTVLARLNL